MFKETISYEDKKVIEYFKESDDFEYCKVFDDDEELSCVQFYNKNNSHNQIYEWKIIKGEK